MGGLGGSIFRRRCPPKNKRGTVGIISTDDSTIKVLRIPTNEELPIARDTLEIVSKL